MTTGRKVDRWARRKDERGKRKAGAQSNEKVKQKGAEFWVRRDTDTETETSFILFFIFFLS
jgi:hypothetical protein